MSLYPKYYSELIFDTNNVFLKNLIKFVLVFYVFNCFFFLFISIVEKDLNSFFTFLLLYFLLYFIAFVNSKLNNSSIKVYLLLCLFYSTLEETLIYFNGGGLGGTAESLYHDLIIAVPAFMGIAIGLTILNKYYTLSPGEFFLFAGLQGIIIEVLIAKNVLALFLFGIAFGIYGIILTPNLSFNSENKNVKRNFLFYFIGIIIPFIFAAILGIIGSIIYTF